MADITITLPPAFVHLQVDVCREELTFTVSLVDKKHDCLLDQAEFDYKGNVGIQQAVYEFKQSLMLNGVT
jgi:hypothetical protein